MPRVIDYDVLPTERARRSPPLDTIGELTLFDLIHEQDRRALVAVTRARRAVVRLAMAASRALAAGGRLIYVGAGTSGRLAALDAAECPPTFGTRAAQVVALVAGGRRALARAVEGAEDSRAAGRDAVRSLAVDGRDLVCGVTASGVTPYVLAALAAARRRGATTALVTCAPARVVRGVADLLVRLDAGAETVAGSTRMKAGLATKAVLHTVSTIAMIRLGKVYGQLMVDVRPTSRKLQRRAERIVAHLTRLDVPAARRLLARAGCPKVAAVMHVRGVERGAALALLAAHDGRLRDVIGDRP